MQCPASPEDGRADGEEYTGDSAAAAPLGNRRRRRHRRHDRHGGRRSYHSPPAPRPLPVVPAASAAAAASSAAGALPLTEKTRPRIPAGESMATTKPPTPRMESAGRSAAKFPGPALSIRSEEHTSELQSHV